MAAFVAGFPHQRRQQRWAFRIQKASPSALCGLCGCNEKASAPHQFQHIVLLDLLLVCGGFRMTSTLSELIIQFSIHALICVLAAPHPPFFVGPRQSQNTNPQRSLSLKAHSATTFWHVLRDLSYEGLMEWKKRALRIISKVLLVLQVGGGFSTSTC